MFEVGEIDETSVSILIWMDAFNTKAVEVFSQAIGNTQKLLKYE